MAGPLKKLGNWEVDYDACIYSCPRYAIYPCSRNGVKATIKVWKKHSFFRELWAEEASLQRFQTLPGVPVVRDSGLSPEGQLCLVMDEVRGSPLSHSLAAGHQLSSTEWALIGRTLLAILLELHEASYVHLGLCPENVFFDGRVVTLLGWDATHPYRPKEHMESLPGNQDFAAPELYFDHCSPASDFYSLACLALYALTGQFAYDFEHITEKAYRPLAHCLQRPRIPVGWDNAWAGVVVDWLGKRPEIRNVQYYPEKFPAYKVTGKEFLDLPISAQLHNDFDYLLKGAHEQIPYCQYQYAILASISGRDTEAWYWLRRSEQRGSIRATGAIAKHDFEAGVFSRDTIDRIEKCAASGDSRGLYLKGLAIMQEHIAGDADEAVRYLKMSASKGSGAACMLLAQQLAEVADSRVQAHQYLLLAAMKGNSKARRLLKPKKDSSAA